MKSFGLTDKGKVRKNNQDCFCIRRCEPKQCLIAALCDGLGGASSGEIASETALNSFGDYVYAKLTSRVHKNPDIKKVLQDACVEANSTVYDYSLFDVSLNGLGTTLVGGIVEDSGAVRLVNVGDSRAYLFRNTGEISQITTDHSLVEDLIRSGVLTREKARKHPQKNIITRAVGTEESVESDYFEAQLYEGDMLLLCSDGLYNYVSEDEMLECFRQYREPEDICQILMALTFERGAGDNVTILSVVNE